MELTSYFRRYLKAIQPSIPNREQAIALHTELQQNLRADEPFKDWYSSTFLYGSYRRNTAIHPIKDVDICVVLNIKPDEHKPEAVVQRLRRVLERNGYKDMTAPQRRSVRIDREGTTLDVVPVVAINGLDNALRIPDRTLAEWVDTHPKQHLAEATRLNDLSNKRYIPFVKIVKAWYRFQMDGVERPKPKGFTLEALVAQYQDADAPSYADRFVIFLDNLWTDCERSLAKGIFPPVPDPGIPGENLRLSISPDEAKQFREIVKTTLADARAALAFEGTDKEGASAWQAIFGPDFPIEPDSAAFATKESAEDAEGEDPESEREVGEIDIPRKRVFGNLKIKAEWYVQKGGRRQNYPSDDRALTKGMWLLFSIAHTSIKGDYTTKWTVKNTGREAEQANDMGHERYGRTSNEEHTKYRGTHTMTCELIQAGTVIARARHTVRIK